MFATHTEFDAHGEPIWKHQFHDQQGWGTETSWMRTYDDQERPLLIARDSTNDGIANEVIRYEYDAFGNLLKEYTDSNADGTPDHPAYFTKPAPGQYRMFETKVQHPQAPLAHRRGVFASSIGDFVKHPSGIS